MFLQDLKTLSFQILQIVLKVSGLVFFVSLQYQVHTKNYEYATKIKMFTLHTKDVMNFFSIPEH